MIKPIDRTSDEEKTTFIMQMPLFSFIQLCKNDNITKTIVESSYDYAY